MNPSRIYCGIGLALIIFGYSIMLFATKKKKMIGGALTGIGVGLCYVYRFPFE